MNATIRTVIAVILVMVIAGSAALVSDKLLGRTRIADLTEDNLYSLSGGTENIIKKLNQPLTLKLYYSRQSALEGPEGIRFWNNYFLYVRDLLEEYARRSNGKIRLEVIDPKTYSIEEEEAINYGLKRFDLNQDSFIFGLCAITDLGKSAAIPFFEPQRQVLVEYDVSKLVSDLSQRKKLTVQVMSSLPVTGDNLPPYMMMMMQQQGKKINQPWAVISELRETYDVQEAKIHEGLLINTPDYLLVIHPKDFSKEQLFAIDQYVIGGGKLIVFTDPFCVIDQPKANPMQRPQEGAQASEINALLEKWGVKTDTKNTVADPENAARLPIRPNQPAEPFAPFMTLSNQSINQEQPLVAGLHNLRFILAGEIKNTLAANIKVTPLVFTSKEANLWAPGPYGLMQPPSLLEMVRNFKAADSGVKNLAVLVQGKFSSNFPDGIEIEIKKDKNQPPQPEAEKAPVETKKLKAIKEAAEENAIIVISDVDMITDQFAFQNNGMFGLSKVSDNSSLLLNALDYLGGESDLLTIRTRGEYLRPFKIVDDIEKKSEEETAGKVDEINKKIQDFQNQLRELVGSRKDGNQEIVKKDIIAKRREIEAEILRANRQLRELQQKKRDKVRALQSKLETSNLIAAPLLVLIIGVIVWLRRRSHKA